MDRLSDLPPDFIDDADVGGPPIDLGPPEPGPGRPLGYDTDPTTGPWFPLSMLVFAATATLTVLSIRLGHTGGPATAWALIGGFVVLFTGYLAVGAWWFGSWRRTPARSLQP
jgi:hypothetical protein